MTLRSLFSGLRRTSHRLVTLVEHLNPPQDGVLVPPAHLRAYYYGTFKLETFRRASAGLRGELLSRGLRPEHRVLDIGSGIGTLALGLIDYLSGGYDGVDIHREAVTWCQRNITPANPAFRFAHADLVSRAYNPRGVIPAASYRFPFADRSFDYIFLASVFTHMLPDDVVHYVEEISRLLTPGGVCVASYFLLNDETRAGVDRGESFMSFRVSHPSGVCRLHDVSVPEAAIAFEESFIRNIHMRAGLKIADVRRGFWWKGTAHDQDLLTVVAE